ncbi:MAG: hypothetical protein DHS80DRAFT_23983 [Piptocephalis tieghemiana]|nr:MAG: hypothetical protein DHS80DRAFT_23983 [Piptocephalis tieghemiana]
MSSTAGQDKKFAFEHEKRRVYWHPLESNPEALTECIRRLGVSPTWAFTDIYGLDPELLAFVPRPVKAVILLFPITENYEKFRKEEQERLSAPGANPVDPSIWYTSQTIGNACGSIAVLHSLANNRDEISIEKGPLTSFYEKGVNLSAKERALQLEEDQDLASAFKLAAESGDTETPAADAPLDLHFVALVRGKDGHLYELDGRKSTGAINHGPCDDLLEGSAKLAKLFMARDPENVQFNLIALTPSGE